MRQTLTPSLAEPTVETAKVEASSFSDIREPSAVAERLAPAIALLKHEHIEAVPNAEEAPAVLRFATAALGHRPESPRELVEAMNAHPAFKETRHTITLLRGECVVTDLSAPKPRLTTSRRDQVTELMNRPMESLEALKIEANVARCAGRFASWPDLMKAWEAATLRDDVKASAMCALTYATYERQTDTKAPVALVNTLTRPQATALAQLPKPAKLTRPDLEEDKARRYAFFKSLTTEEVKAYLEPAIALFATRDPKKELAEAKVRLDKTPPGTESEAVAHHRRNIALIASKIPHPLVPLQSGQSTFAPPGMQEEDTLLPPNRARMAVVIKQADHAFDDDAQRSVKLRADYARKALCVQLAAAGHADLVSGASYRHDHHLRDSRQDAVDAAYAVLVVEGRLDPLGGRDVDD